MNGNMTLPIEIWGEIFTHLNIRGLSYVSRCNLDLNSMISTTISLYKKMDRIKSACDTFNRESYLKDNEDLNFYVSFDGFLNVIEPVRIERLWKTVFNYFGSVDKHVEIKIKETIESAFKILTYHFLYPKAFPVDDHFISLTESSYRSVKHLKNNQYGHLFDPDFYIKFKDLQVLIMKKAYPEASDNTEL